MFLPCPNCGFLVALVKPKNSATEQRCPRCGHVLVSATAGDAPSAPLDRTRTMPGTEEAVSDTGGRAGMQPVTTPPTSHSPSPPERAPDGTAPHVRADNELTGPAAESGGHRTEPTPPGKLHRSRTATDAPAAHPHPEAEASPVHSQTAPAPPVAHGRRAPSFARHRIRSASRPRRWPLYLASGALALVLALQLVLAQLDALAAAPRWRPAVETLCSALGCTVPAWREPSAFTMLDRSVQPKAGAPGVLTARASFRNDARWPQPWPTLVLTLSGVDGEPLGARAFAPAEYAGDPRASLAPGQSASAQLDIVEPGPGVVAFAFDFH